MSDLPLLFSSTAICLAVILLTLRFNKRVTIINGIIFVGYSTYFYHGLFYDAAQGTGLVWLFFILLAHLVQFVIVCAYLAIKMVQAKRKRQQQSR